MKQLLLTLLFSFTCIFLSAQDTIIKRNGNQIIAKVLEISSTEVKYKKFDYQDGPTYVDNKSDVKMIRYANGVKDEFQQEVIQSTVTNDQTTNDYYSGSVTNDNNSNKIEQYGIRYHYKNATISEREVHTILFQSKDKKIISLVGSAKDARTMQFIGFGAIPFGVATMVFLVESAMHPTYSVSYQRQLNSKYLTLSGVCLVGTIACPIVSGVYRHKSSNYNRAAIKLYNEKF